VNVIQFPSGTSDSSIASEASDPIDGAELLYDVHTWFSRFIKPLDAEDLYLLALWAVHTHVARHVGTTPRLQIDSSMFGSGKTTLCEHLERLCHDGLLISLASSVAPLARVVAAASDAPPTLIIDEADRNLDPKRDGSADLYSLINSGYRVGASRLISTRCDSGQWTTERQSVHAPVVISGNAPMLPDDTRSRIIRVLLVPDRHDSVDETDWEEIGSEATTLHKRITDWVAQISDRMRDYAIELPEECKARNKEKWRPLMRVAAAADGNRVPRWRRHCWDLIERDLNEQRRTREDGHVAMPPAMRLMHDMFAIGLTPDGQLYGRSFVATRDWLACLAVFNPEDWSADNFRGKALNAQAFGRMLRQVANIHSHEEIHPAQPERGGPRGYWMRDIARACAALGLGDGTAAHRQVVPDATDATGAADDVSVTDTSDSPVTSDSSDGMERSDSKRVEHTVVCQHCRGIFAAYRSDAKYCSNACRQSAYQARRSAR